jgi:SAM-dependent methyltransferase
MVYEGEKMNTIQNKEGYWKRAGRLFRPRKIGEARITIETEAKHPVESPDYTDPAGCVNDNNSNKKFFKELRRYHRKRLYSLLDLGCAGGQFVVDHHTRGHVAVGLEGGNEEVMLHEAAGKHNWQAYKNICLFHADISKPFRILNEGSPMEFDVISAWDVLEHPTPEEIPAVIDNIRKHLKKDGIFVGTINPSEGEKHRCAKDKDWWDRMFESKGFEVRQYPFSCSARRDLNSVDYAAMFVIKG